MGEDGIKRGREGDAEEEVAKGIDKEKKVKKIRRMIKANEKQENGEWIREKREDEIKRPSRARNKGNK